MVYLNRREVVNLLRRGLASGAGFSSNDNLQLSNTISWQ